MNKEQLLAAFGQPRKVLNKGHVRLVDFMGDDAAVVQAARVSYGKGLGEHDWKPNRSPDDEELICTACRFVIVKGDDFNPHCKKADENLIRYLMRHHHGTPFEMCELKLHIRMPMDAHRQQIRHRTACIAGDVPVSFDLPGGKTGNGNPRHYPLTMREIYNRWQPTQNVSNPENQKNPLFKRERVKEMRLRSLNEDTGEIYYTSVRDIWSNGIKTVYDVKFDDGSHLRATLDHRVYTDVGWLTLDAALEQGAQFYSSGKAPAPRRTSPDFTPAELANERWKTVILRGKAWDQYEVSDLGRVRSRTRGGQTADGTVQNRAPKLKKLTSVGAGKLYRGVSLSSGGKSRLFHVHRMVLETFVGQRRSDQEARHLDGCGANNRLSNITWGSAQENHDDRMAQGGHQTLTGKLINVIDVSIAGEEETFDLSVEGPFHNFFAGGVVVHNSVNEFSTRYSHVDLVVEDEELGLRIVGMAETDPREWRLQSRSSKQGSSGEYLPYGTGVDLSAQERDFQLRAYEVYENRLAHGVAKEVARKDLPLSCYTEYYWKMDLRNLLGYLRLRLDSHAQYEIRMYAEAIWEIVQAWVPMTAAAFVDYQLRAHTFSCQELVALQDVFKDWILTHEAIAESEGRDFDRKASLKKMADAYDLGSSRERKAFWTTLGLL